MVVASFCPLVASEPFGGEPETSSMADGLGGFNPPLEGKQYMFSESEVPSFSATTFLKKQWIEDGYPGVILPFSPSYQNSRHSARSCEDAWSVDDTDNITTSDGTISATVTKVSANAAILVEDGQVISSTTLNDITATWESIIYPTDTNYFGDTPDVDNNCQIEIIIHSVDGPGGTGGYFHPGISALRESLFIDVDDLGGRNAILAYELEHLIHNAWDPFEYIWIDEGAAGLAAYLCFGINDTLRRNANDWASGGWDDIYNGSLVGLRWFNGRTSDYGSGFLFMTYLADKLGGAPAIRRLIADTSLGGSGIENLARNPEFGSTLIGSTMSEIFANFSAAVVLDSPQGAFGFSNLDMNGRHGDDCVQGHFCKVQPTGSTEQWNDDWQWPGETIEGWGLATYRFSQGTGDPLNLMVQPDRFGFEGAILVREAMTGTWTMSELRVDSSTGIGTGLIHDFGNATAEVWLLVWYNSLNDDCDYDFANCGILPGGLYPSGSITVNAGLITEPAEVTIDSVQTFDRDGDSLHDSVEIRIDISSNAYYEILGVSFEAYTENVPTDSLQFNIAVGNGDPVSRAIWFTPSHSGEWSFSVRIRDITGELQGEGFSLPVQIYNMKPVVSGSISTPSTQTWLSTHMFGGGYDAWGFGLHNGSFNHNETPSAYIWDLGDGNGSNLKNPVHSYMGEGEYHIILVVMDQGGYYSEAQTWNISVNDSSSPVPEISVEGVVISSELTFQTNQRIQFSARGTSDNVPIEHLTFSWDWGDGESDSGVGLYEVGHSWVDGNADGTVYSLELRVSDGPHSSEQTILIRILNRVPRQIHDELMQTYTLTPLSMPDIFVDDDGMIMEHRWDFEDGVNLDGVGVTLTSDFSETTSFLSNPIVGWLEPGMKNVTLQVRDDDGNISIALLQVEVLNQRPVAIFNRPMDGGVRTAYVFESESFDPDGDSSELTHVWSISDMAGTVENVLSISRSFLNPGLYSVSLVVIDELGLESAPKTYLFEIDNPLPVPILSFSCPSLSGMILDYVPEDEDGIVWQVPHTEDGGAFVAPGFPLRFDGSNSHDMDPRFTGKTSTDPMDSDWNGIVSWIWDFGDASPAMLGPIVWHEYERPGAYIVRLTVIDGFAGGESNTTEMIVHVSQPPKILTTNPLSSEYVIVGDKVELSGSAIDPDLEYGITAWLDVDADFDNDGDGDQSRDKDINLTGSLEILWDLDVFTDDDCYKLEGCDGDPRNDWVMSNQTWKEPGEVRIAMTVCDGVGVCSSKDYVVTVLSIQDIAPPKTLSDLNWTDFIPDRKSVGLLSLVALVALLGWMVMRQKDDEELDARDMVEKYGVEEVKAEGGLPGMDQHVPPPEPRYLTSEERTNEESGYVRPIRTRRG
jgi:PKD repeat protein